MNGIMDWQHKGAGAYIMLDGVHSLLWGFLLKILLDDQEINLTNKWNLA